jgi:hypothetical protein
VIDEPLPAARLSRRTLSVVTATSNEERVPETPPSGGVLVLTRCQFSFLVSATGPKALPWDVKMIAQQGVKRGGVTMLMLLTDFVLFSGSAPCITGIVIAVASLLS